MPLSALCACRGSNSRDGYIAIIIYLHDQYYQYYVYIHDWLQPQKQQYRAANATLFILRLETMNKL